MALSKKTNSEETLYETDPKLEREMQLLQEREGLGQISDKLLNDFGFSMNRLHDPCNYDHTTLEEMLSNYHFRDLAKSKLFRIAKKIFGDKMEPKFRIRTRAFNLTGMNQGKPVISGAKSAPTVFPDPPATNDSDDEDLVDVNDLRLQKRPIPPIPTDSNTLQQMTEEEQLDDYSSWYAERRNLRQQLDSLGLNESWLRNKPNKTEMEAALYKRMCDERRVDVAEEDDFFDADEISTSPEVKAEGLPKIRRPSPIAIRKLDRFMKSNHLRLIDIFRTIDKDKTWTINRDSFTAAIKEYDMNINGSVLEDLITTLDINQTGVLCYKELVKGLELYKLEKRHTKKKGLPMPQDDNGDSAEPEYPAKSGSSSRVTSSKKGRDQTKSAQSSKPSRTSSATTLLQTPEPDIGESRLVLDSLEDQVDLRKRDKNFLKYQQSQQRLQQRSASRGSGEQTAPTLGKDTSRQVAAFKTGYKPIDEHCKRSMLVGEIGEMVNEFRQLKLKEYYSIMNLCEEKGIALSRPLLDRVLLYPGDKTTRMILRQGVRQPDESALLSSHFADPPKRPRTPIEIRNRGKIKRGPDGHLLIDYKHRFASKKKAMPKSAKVQLPTGKASISRKVDCWLTFEDYERMTKVFYKKRYVRMEPDSDTAKNTWPGYMLDKMRVYLDTDRTGEATNPLFHGVKRERKAVHGYDNDLRNWPVSDTGYLNQPFLEHPKKQYATSNLQAAVKPNLPHKNHLVHKFTQDLTMHTATQ